MQRFSTPIFIISSITPSGFSPDKLVLTPQQLFLVGLQSPKMNRRLIKHSLQAMRQ
jgi:hypothetical protein